MSVPRTLLCLFLLVTAGCLAAVDPEEADEANQALAPSNDPGSSLSARNASPPYPATVRDPAWPGNTSAQPPVGHTLARKGVHEPAAFEAPSFAEPSTLLTLPPWIGGGEPSVWAHWEGPLFVAFPGCTSPEVVGGPVDEDCEHDQVFRSLDLGGSWEHLNDQPEDRFTPHGPEAGGDTDVVVDGDGTVYVASLFNVSQEPDGLAEERENLPLWRSEDHGETWTYLGGLSPKGETADRHWLATGYADHLVGTWRGSQGLTARTSFDGGRTFSEPVVLGKDTNNAGAAVVAPDGHSVVIPLVRGAPPIPAVDPESREEIYLAKSTDGGLSWELLRTGVLLGEAPNRLPFTALIGFPSVDVTQDGTIVLVWGEPTPGPAGAAQDGAQIRMIASKDGGATWTQPTTLSERKSAVFPWVVGGGGDRVAVSWYAADQGLSTDRVGLWDVMTTVVDDPAGEPQAEPVVVDAGVHEGGICSHGLWCLFTAGDRSLLDFFENDVLPDGRIVVSYAADPAEEGRGVQIRVAIQDGGSPLFDVASP